MHWLRSLLLTVLVCFFAVLPACAEDWPQWLGPRRDNSSKERVAPWKDKLQVLWRKPAGEGHSSPIVAEGRVFIHAKVADKNEEEIVAFDAKSGEELWRKRYERAAFRSLYGNGPRATPAIVDGRLYTFGITGVLTCLDTKSGDKLWQVDTLQKFKAKNLFFGMACSPLVAGDRVLVNVGGHAQLVADITTVADRLWHEHIVPGIPPQASGNPAALVDLYDALNPDRGGVATLDRDLDAFDALHAYLDAGADESAAKRRKDAAKAVLVGALRGAEVGVMDEQAVFTYQSASRSYADLALLAEQFPEAYAACVSDRPSRRLNITNAFRKRWEASR